MNSDKPDKFYCFDYLEHLDSIVLVDVASGARLEAARVIDDEIFLKPLAEISDSRFVKADAVIKNLNEVMSSTLLPEDRDQREMGSFYRNLISDLNEKVLDVDSYFLGTVMVNLGQPYCKGLHFDDRSELMIRIKAEDRAEAIENYEIAKKAGFVVWSLNLDDDNYSKDEMTIDSVEELISIYEDDDGQSFEMAVETHDHEEKNDMREAFKDSVTIQKERDFCNLFIKATVIRDYDHEMMNLSFLTQSDDVISILDDGLVGTLKPKDLVGQDMKNHIEAIGEKLYDSDVDIPQLEREIKSSHHLSTRLIQAKKITYNSLSMLSTLADHEDFVGMRFDNLNNLIAVDMKKHQPYGHNQFGLEGFSGSSVGVDSAGGVAPDGGLVKGGYLVPYDYGMRKSMDMSGVNQEAPSVSRR